MKENMLLYIAIGGLVLAFLIYKRLTKVIKNKKQQSAHAEAQMIYFNTKKKDKKTLFTSLEEKVELSWQFLYEITEIVLNKFSSQDRTEVHNLGNELSTNGMRYEHIVELGIRPQPKTLATDIEQQKDAKPTERGR